MFERVHEMRTRMITSPSFSGDKIIGAILFENTMDREIMVFPPGSFCGRRKALFHLSNVTKVSPTKPTVFSS